MPFIIFLVLFFPLLYVTVRRTINLIITQNLMMNSGKKTAGSSGQQRPPGCIGQGRQDAMTTKCTVARNVCGFSGGNLFCVKRLAPIILRRFLEFWKFFLLFWAKKCLLICHWTTNRFREILKEERTGSVPTFSKCLIPDGFIGIFHWNSPSASTMALGLTQPLTEMSKSKGKAIPLQAWTGPEGSRTLRLPDFKTIGTWWW